MERKIADKIRASIREVADFPKPGINFYDITTVLSDGTLFREIIETLGGRYRTRNVTAVVGIEARGFIFGGALSHELGTAFIPVRKHGKLPSAVERCSYSLEYGEDVLEIHKDALSNSDRVVVIDDLLATGGTAKTACSLIERLGAEIIEFAFIVELSFLRGRKELDGTSVVSMVKYDK